MSFVTERELALQDAQRRGQDPAESSLDAQTPPEIHTRPQENPPVDDRDLERGVELLAAVL